MDSETSLPSTHIAQQRFKLRVWISSKLWAQVIAGMVLGFGLGLLLNQSSGLVTPDTAEIIGIWLALPGNIFLALIEMVLVSLVFSSIVGGLSSAASGSELRSVGLRLGAFILATTTGAAVLGVALAQWLQPGLALTGFAVPQDSALSGQAAAEAQAPDATSQTTLPDLGSGLITRI